MDAALGMIVYSALLSFGLLVSAPWWGWRMLRSGRYRAGLGQRLGRVPKEVQAAVAGKQVVWVHAVSVGEVLAAAHLIAGLQQALGEGWQIAVSTTTATGQAIATDRLAPIGCLVFYFPLDFGFAVRRWMRVLQPRLLVLVESELWPRLLASCEAAGVPVVVVNARMSDRSFRRARQAKQLWRWMGSKVTQWLAQSEETAARLRQLGMENIRVSGNLKYDGAAQAITPTARRLQYLVGGRKLVVAGSTLAGEEERILSAWKQVVLSAPEAQLLIAPRHPERFKEIESLMHDSDLARCVSVSRDEFHEARLVEGGAVYLLDTLGDLAAVYALATVAFIGGSLVPRGGHNPLEAARFGVPVVMGPSYENFREIVDGMRAADAIRIIQAEQLASALEDLLQHGQAMGERGRLFYESQTGATQQTVAALLQLLNSRELIA